jgi:hypothetical protein
MKKLLFIALLVTSFTINAQDTFVRTYTKMSKRENYIEYKAEDVDLNVVFNPDGKKVVKLYYSDGKIKTLMQTSSVKEGETKNGEKYQLIDTIDSSTGYNVILQLFDLNGTLRLIVAPGYTIEFYE